MSSDAAAVAWQLFYYWRMFSHQKQDTERQLSTKRLLSSEKMILLFLISGTPTRRVSP